jgi:probable phosphoglycerate mutase
MTTTFFLLRHAAHDDLGSYLAGRSRDVFLGPAGRAQAARLGNRMRRESFDAIFSSPRKRAWETAQAVSRACEVQPVTAHDDLDEIDFGSWSGKTFVELDADPAWRHWNRDRNVASTPAGENMANVGGRICECMQELSRLFSGGAIVLVSHADVIKCAICQTLGLSPDGCFRFDIDPASISVVAAGDWGAKVLRLNEST